MITHAQSQFSAILSFKEATFPEWANLFSNKLLNLNHSLVIKGNKSKRIYKRMAAFYDESSPSSYVVKLWSKKFNWGRKTTEDDPHSRPL
ncbi:hypothetical protein ILUMI_26749 [Ignelater luminosus]|uniref:Uncharacterized protein n=1 Tax=Ignelater luminosus TaxID=2038154 RepID=A0A8K0FYD4_IGNLU|nr:hypothetical protein ILUMI_26749 [Ignelater luminosus]